MKNNLSSSSHQYYFSYLNNFALLLHPWICQSVCLQSQDCQTVKAVKASINVSNDSYKFYSSLVCYKRKVFTQNIYVYFHKKIISQSCLLCVPKLDVILKYPHSLHRGQNPPPFMNNLPSLPDYWLSTHFLTFFNSLNSMASQSFSICMQILQFV